MGNIYSKEIKLTDNLGNIATDRNAMATIKIETINYI